MDEVEALRVLFEHSPVPQFVADVRGALLLANPAYAALVGVPSRRSSAPSRPTSRTPTDLSVLIREGGRLLAGEVDVISLRAAGALRRRHLPVVPGHVLVGAARRPASSWWCASSWTSTTGAERRRSWPRARSRCNRLAAIAETTADLVGVVDGNGWVIWANDAARAAHGIDLEPVPLHSARLYTQESVTHFFEPHPADPAPGRAVDGRARDVRRRRAGDLDLAEPGSAARRRRGAREHRGGGPRPHRPEAARGRPRPPRHPRCPHRTAEPGPAARSARGGGGHRPLVHDG